MKRARPTRWKKARPQAMWFAKVGKRSVEFPQVGAKPACSAPGQNFPTWMVADDCTAVAHPPLICVAHGIYLYGTSKTLTWGARQSPNPYSSFHAGPHVMPTSPS